MNFDLQTVQVLLVTYGVRLIAAILIFIIGRWIARKITNFVIKVLETRSVDITLIRFLDNIIYYLMMVAVLVAAAGQLGINTTSFLTVLGAASLAVGLALKDSLSNFASGVMLILFRPYRVGDAINAAGETGTVEEISVFNTILNTFDNQRKIIPNSMITAGAITNINANPTRRVDLVAGISYDDDIRKAKEILEKILAEQELVLQDPAPTVAVSELADSSINFIVRPWVKTKDYWTVYFDVTEQIKLQFDANGISIPFPQRDVHMFTEKAAA